jgi:hypothetical protein
VRNPFVRKHPFGDEALSSYLDRRLSPAESARLEKHLASCEPCRRHLEELRAVVEGLHALPSMPARRSFALRPEQVEAAQRSTPVRPTAWAQRAPAFAPAGVAVAALVVFLVLVGVDLGTLGGGGGPQGVAPPRAAKEGQGAGEAMSAAPAPTPAPALGALAPSDEYAGAATPEPTVGPATPTEAPPPPLAPSGTAGGGAGTGRWILRGFQGFAGAAFLGAMAALVWQRRRRRGTGHT